MSQKKWMLIFAVLILAMAGIYLLLTRHGGESRVVIISSRSQVLWTIDLNESPDRDLEVHDGKGGTNTIQIRSGEIYVHEADCPDGICVSHGPLKKNGTPIVCLPHQLVIRWAEDGSEVDH